jgi:hypothetical protein
MTKSQPTKDIGYFTVSDSFGRDIGGYLQQNRAYFEELVNEQLGLPQQSHNQQHIFVSHTSIQKDKTICSIAFKNFDGADMREVENALKREVWSAFHGECACDNTKPLTNEEFSSIKRQYSDTALGLDKASQMKKHMSNLSTRPVAQLQPVYVMDKSYSNDSFSY